MRKRPARRRRGSPWGVIVGALALLALAWFFAFGLERLVFAPRPVP